MCLITLVRCSTLIVTEECLLHPSRNPHYGKAGIEAQFVARGEYKSAANMFTQDRYTEPHREADGRLIESLRAPTLDFITGKPTTLLYTRAKVVDMAFFIEGGYPG